MTSPRPPRRLSPAYVTVRTIVRPLLLGLTRRDWHGAEHLPADRGFIACANHISHVDPFTFGHFLLDHGCPPRYLAKESVFTIPVLGRIVSGAEQIPVYRETSQARNAFSAAVEAVRRGECVAIYPEGTVTRDPHLWPMVGKTGAARIALATGCPVIPIAQWGPQDLLAPYARVPHPFPRKTMHVWAGPPVDLAAFDGREDQDALRGATDSIIEAITDLLEQIRGERAPAKRWDPREHGQPRIGNFKRPRGSAA